MESDMFQSAELRKYTGPVAGVKVLVVDDNSACRAVISKLLLSIGFEVVTATRASDALFIIGEKENKINLVLVEAQLPDMEVCELIEKLKQNSKISSFIMTAYDDDVPSVSKGLSAGAELCFRKPVQISDLQKLWRFVVWNQSETTFSDEVFDYWWPLSEVVTLSEGLKRQPSMNTKEQSFQSLNDVECQSSLITEQSVESVNCNEQESFDEVTGVLLKRKRNSGADDLHRKFLDAVQMAGIDAEPMIIFKLMDMEGLTIESVSNFSQKYRETMDLCATAMAEHFNEYLSLTKKSRGTQPPSLGNQGLTNNAAFNQKDRVPVSIIDTSARYLTLESSSSKESSVGQNQLSQPLKQQGVADSSSDIGQQLDVSTPLAFKMSDKLCPRLVTGLLPLEKNEKIDEIYYAKESQMFTDEDLNMWLSTILDNVNHDAYA